MIQKLEVAHESQLSKINDLDVAIESAKVGVLVYALYWDKTLG